MMYPVVTMPTQGQKLTKDVLVALRDAPKDFLYPASTDDPIWRVRAGVTIPAGITVGPYPSEMLLGTNTTDHLKGEKYIEVKVDNKTLVPYPDVYTTQHWLLHVTPARDRHEQNVEAIRDARGMIAFRVIKEIQNGDELFVWYSTELAMECNIPILTPANIRGGQEYACTSCDTTFAYPNTLKAHILFLCPRNAVTSWLSHQSIALQTSNLLTAYQLEMSKYLSYLWTVSTIDNPRDMSNIPTPLDLNASLLSAKSAFCPSSVPFSGTTRTKTPALSHTVSRETYADLSTNWGKKTQVTECNHQNTNDNSPVTSYPAVMSLPNCRHVDCVYVCKYTRSPSLCSNGLSASQHQLSLTTLPSMPSRDTQVKHLSHHGFGCHADMIHHKNSDGDSSPRLPIDHINFPMLSDTAGEPIDLLPKSLYTSKAYKGHLCIYCGKLHSRKYGLKIHLRTHTGYKPLKCKVCLRAFGDPSNLNKHIRLHAEGDTPYRCEYCGKVLVRRRDLERHIKSRHQNHASSMMSYHDDQSETTGDSDTSLVCIDDDVGDVSVCKSPINMSCRQSTVP